MYQSNKAALFKRYVESYLSLITHDNETIKTVINSVSLLLPNYARRAETQFISKCRGRFFGNAALIYVSSISLPLTYTFVVQYRWVELGQACKCMRVNRVSEIFKTKCKVHVT
jgi:hypothetical protein